MFGRWCGGESLADKGRSLRSEGKNSLFDHAGEEGRGADAVGLVCSDLEGSSGMIKKAVLPFTSKTSPSIGNTFSAAPATKHDNAKTNANTF